MSYLESGSLEFWIDGLVTFRTLAREHKNVIRFGELSKPAMCVFGVVGGVVSIIPFLSKAIGIAFPLSLFPLAGVLIGFGLYFLRQRQLKGLELEVEPARCVLRGLHSAQVIDGVQAVYVVNSYSYRNKCSAPDGVSELFLQIGSGGELLLVPIACDSNYGELDHLGQTISNHVGKELKITTRE